MNTPLLSAYFMGGIDTCQDYSCGWMCFASAEAAEVPHMGDVQACWFVHYAIMVHDVLSPSQPIGRIALRPLRWADPALAAVGLGGAMSLPVGTVSFLLTDIASSTLMWQQSPDEMAVAVARHYQILDDAIAAHGGVRPEEQGEGDSVVAAFSRASDAVSAALQAQLALRDEPWPTPTPVLVRMAVHTGEARLRDEANYVGLAIIRTARLRNIAHGGQVLISAASRDLALDQMGDRLSLLDLNEHRLKDLARPERVYQLVHPGLPGSFEPLRSLDATPNNLPVKLSTFIGREAELASVAGLLVNNRLVTVIGSGGAGKTRLALHAAADLADRYPDGVWWLELAPLAAGSDIGPVWAATLSVRLDESTPVVDAICRRLADDRALIVVDNCEHVFDSVGDLVAAVVQRCPHASVLATSRGMLDVPGEVTWRIPPLSLPAVGAITPVERLGQFDAVRLFVDGARRARPTFALNDDNGPVVAEICHRLDGIPLAIELAAARTKSLTPARILDGLGDALRLLTGGSRMSVPRQQTLEASIGWSVALLADREQSLFAHLSVFAGSFDLEAAESVCSNQDLDAMEVLDALERLIDHSLVMVTDDDAGRFMLLEMVRQYGARLLDGSGTAVAARRRHADYFAGLAGRQAPGIETSQQNAATTRLDADLSNLMLALSWFELQRDSESLAAMACELNFYWYFTGRQLDSVGWFSRALDLLPEGPSLWRARLLANRSNARFALGEFLGCVADADAAITMGALVGDACAEGRGRWSLAAVLGFVDLDGFWEMSDRAIELLERADDRFAAVEARMWRAAPLMGRGFIVEGVAELDRSWPAVEALGNPYLIGSHLQHQANAALWSGKLGDAQQLAQRSLAASAAGNQLSFTRLIICMAATFSGAEVSTLDEVDLWIQTARRNGELMALDNYLMAKVHQLLAVDARQAVAAADGLIASDTGVVPLYSARYLAEGAWAYFGAGDRSRAAELVAQAQPHAAQSQFVFIQAYLAMLNGLLLMHRNEILAAEQSVREAISSADRHGSYLPRCLALECFAVVAAAAGDFTDTARILGATSTIRDGMGLAYSFVGLDIEVTAATEHARQALGDEDYEKAFVAGSLLSADEIVAYINRARGDRRRPSSGWDSLTPTELQVVDLIRAGRTNREVAAELLMGTETVKTHVSHIFTKLGISNRAQLAVEATHHVAAAPHRTKGMNQ